METSIGVGLSGILIIMLAYIIDKNTNQKIPIYQSRTEKRIDFIIKSLKKIGGRGTINDVLNVMSEKNYNLFGKNRAERRRNLSQTMLYYSRKNKHWERCWLPGSNLTYKLIK